MNILITLLVLISANAFAEASSDKKSLAEIAMESHSRMSCDDEGCSGPGWEHIQEKVRAANYVMVGEDHFTKEIPRLIDAIGGADTFEKFFIEVDPFSTRLIDNTFNLSAPDRESFNREHSDMYSFFALKEEYGLLASMKARGAGLLGSDQIVMYADRLLLEPLIAQTPNPEAKVIYQRIVNESKRLYDTFIAEKGSPGSMYFMTPALQEDLAALEALDLPEHEAALVHYMKTSADIYKTGSHRKRVSLIKHHLMQALNEWRGRKTLFKYGANHMTRGESFLTVHDIGVLVTNIADADYQRTYHLMVLGEEGEQASPFRGFPPSTIDPKGFYLAHIEPFMTLTDEASWHVFDMLPLRRALIRGQLAVDNVNLRRTIMGFDTLVLIPRVTPAGFPEY